MTLRGTREVRKLVKDCLERGNRPIPLPHCAICARYAKDNLPFECVLAFLDSLPVKSAARFSVDIERALDELPAGYRQQLVSVDNIAAILEAPSFRLVRSLVMDLHGEGLDKHLTDQRLSQIEEITLLGYAYGGPDIPPQFLQALVTSAALVSVRKFTLHSGEANDECRSLFWGSRFAARLREISGFPYRGELIGEPLRARAIRGIGAWSELPRNQSFLPLLKPATTPHLTHLAVSAGLTGNQSLIDALQTGVAELARLRSVSVSFYGLEPLQVQQLQQLELPTSVSSIRSSIDARGDIITLDCDTLHVIKKESRELERIQGCDRITDFGNVLFELDATEHLSRSLKKLNIIVPPDQSVAALLESCERFRGLEDLTVIFPFSYSQAVEFGRSAHVRGLSKLHLVLSLRGGWSTTDYKKQHCDSYQADISADQVCMLAVGDAFRRIDNLTIYHDTLEIGRSPGEYQHVTLGNSAASRSMARLLKKQPIETLKITTNLTAEDFKALARAKVFARVYRLILDECLDDAAMNQFVRDRYLAHVRVLVLSWFHHLSATAFKQFITCSHWKNVRDFYYAVNVPRAGQIVARSKLLPGIVSLGSSNSESAKELPKRNRLVFLRRIDESLSLRLFTDARMAKNWLRARPSTPLKARLQAFVRRMYSLDDPRSMKQLIADLKSAQSRELDYDERTRRTSIDMAALLAKAFAGRPVPVGTEFGDLSIEQKRALRVLDRIGDDWWNVDNVMSEPLASYGFDFYQDGFREFQAGKRTSE